MYSFATSITSVFGLTGLFPTDRAGGCLVRYVAAVRCVLHFPQHERQVRPKFSISLKR
jgi:hypothetical protein